MFFLLSGKRVLSTLAAERVWEEEKMGNQATPQGDRGGRESQVGGGVIRMTENRRAESVRCVGKKKNGGSGRLPFTKAGAVLVSSE